MNIIISPSESTFKEHWFPNNRAFYGEDVEYLLFTTYILAVLAFVNI